MRIRMLAVAGMSALAALAGCTGGPDPAAAPSATPSSNQAAALALAQCQRANGHPDFPDPVKDDEGRWTFPPEVAGDWRPAEACRPLVHAWKIAFADEGATSGEHMAKVREYAACMRQHGLEDFPDPGEDGNIELPERLRVLADTRDPAFDGPHRACEHFLPPKPAGKD